MSDIIVKSIEIAAPVSRVWEALTDYRQFGKLEPKGAGTLITVTESGFDAIPKHRRAEAYRMNDGGWAEQLSNIQRHVQLATSTA